MVSIGCCHALLLSTILVACSSQEEMSFRAPVERWYTLSDRSESASTGNILEQIYPLPPESCTNCKICTTQKFRTFDGTCNHPRNLGASSKPLDSMLPPAYDDGISTPRVRGKNGNLLPSARNVSLRVHPPTDVLIDFPIILMQWGQWIAHDVIATAFIEILVTEVRVARFTRIRPRAYGDFGQVPEGNISCCGPHGSPPPPVTNRNCFPIKLPKEEKFFPGTCLSFVRSMPFRDFCNTSHPRQQINTATSFHDASQLYGSDDRTAALVRENGGYLLRTKNGNFLSEGSRTACIRTKPHHYCFQSGDFRVNQHPYLGALNTVWLREHNRIATRLRKLKPKLPNEEIFQITRKIIVGMHQVITFNAYLPIILGDDVIRYRLNSTNGRSSYNPSLNPSVSTAFSTAAFRFGHSTVPRLFPIGIRLEQLRDLFNRPGEVIDNYDDVIAGMAGVSGARERRVQASDRNFVPDISQFLFMNSTTGRGLDLVSINIQRGRDHGLPPYVQWRKFCGLRPLKGFNDVEALGPFVSGLGKVYSSVNDIDLYTGLLHEPIGKGLVGPTIRCIMGNQFQRLKFGDRFFFDNDVKTSRFTDDQLKEIRKTTLSKILCRNSNIKQIPQNVFRFQSRSNPLTSCATLRGQDLNLALF